MSGQGTLSDIHNELYSKALAERDSRLASISEWKDCFLMARRQTAQILLYRMALCGESVPS